MNPYPELMKKDNCIFRVAVKAVIIHDNKVLLIRDDPDDLWALPGGGIDYGENAEQALIRELHEEIALSSADILSEPKLCCVTAGHIRSGIPRVNIYYDLNVSATKIKVGDDSIAIMWQGIDGLRDVDYDKSNGDMAQLFDHIESLLKKN